MVDIRDTEHFIFGDFEWWCVNDQYHRLDGPASIRKSGVQAWYINGLRHRIDGPAVIYANGERQWWVNGKRHRIDGPAIIWSNGQQDWFIHGESLSHEVKKWMEDREVTWPWDDATQVEFLLTWL